MSDPALRIVSEHFPFHGGEVCLEIDPEGRVIKRTWVRSLPGFHQEWLPVGPEANRVSPELLTSLREMTPGSFQVVPLELEGPTGMTRWECTCFLAPGGHWHLLCREIERICQAVDGFEKHQALVRLVSEISRGSSRGAGEGIDELLRQAVTTISGFLPARGGAAYFLVPEEMNMVRREGWVRPDSREDRPGLAEVIPLSKFPELLGLLNQGEPFVTGRHKPSLALQEEWGRLLGDSGEPVLFLPLPTGLMVCGFVCFWVSTRFLLREDDVSALRLLGEVLAGAVERHRLETFQAQSQERLNGILNSLEDSVWAIDSQRNQLMFFNPASERILGRSAVDLLDNPGIWFDAAVAEDFPLVASWRDQVARDGQAEFEYRIRRGDGVIRRLHVRVWSADSASGAPARIDGIAMDVTERVEAQERLRAQQNLLENLIESLHSGILVTNEDQRVTHWNKFFREILKPGADPPDSSPRGARAGVGAGAGSASDLDGLDWVGLLADRLVGRPDDFRAAVSALAAERRPAVGREMLFKTGRAFELDYIPLFIGEGFTGDVWQFRDITPQKEAARAIQEAGAKEAEIAGKIQQALLIGQPPINLEGVQVSSLTIPSCGIDGDFYDFFEHGPGCFDVIVGDVMGKGIPAALVGAGTKSAFLRSLADHSLASCGELLPSPAELTNRTHARLTGQLITLQRFVTLTYARFDLKRMILEFVDCGHTKTLLYRPGSAEMMFLDGENCPLGFFEEEIYRQTTVQLKVGDVLMFYSDGVTEAASPAGVMFDVAGIEAVLRENSTLSSGHLVNALHQRVVDFTGTRHFADDLTCIAVKIGGSGAGGGSSCSEAEFSSDLENIPKIREFALTVLNGGCGRMFDDEERSELILALSEAAANIFIHVFDRRCDQRLRVQIRAFDDRVEIWLLYAGPDFSPPHLEEPSLADGREGGFGLFLIQQAVSEVIYDRLDAGTRRIALIKYPAKASERG
jgi:PAS domain S-box-containing protein